MNSFDEKKYSKKKNKTPQIKIKYEEIQYLNIEQISRKQQISTNQNKQINQDIILSPQKKQISIKAQLFEYQIKQQIINFNHFLNSEKMLKEKQKIRILIKNYQLHKKSSKNISINLIIQNYLILQMFKKSLKQKNIQQIFQILHIYNNFSLSQNILLGIDQIFTSQNIIKKIKRSFYLEKIYFISIGYFLASNKFIKFSRYFQTLIQIFIENLLILVKNIIKSETIDYIAKNYYPKIEQKEIQQVLSNNKKIDAILLKLSAQNQIYFTKIHQLTLNFIQLSLNKLYKQLLQFLAFQINIAFLFKQGKFLSTAPQPYIKTNLEKYYLVFDFIDFIHRNQKKQIQFRPFLQNFIENLSQKFTLINYTNWLPFEAQKIFNSFNKSQLIKYQLYSHHFKFFPKFQRNIQGIGARKQKIIYITTDNQQESLKKNKLVYKKWKGDKNDKQLIQLASILLMIPHKSLNCSLITQQIQKSHTKELKQINQLFFSKILIN